MPVQICFLDIDGVLADFYHGAIKALGKDNEEVEKNLPPGTWSMESACGVTEGEFWATINKIPDFWESLDVLPHAKGIIKACEKHYKEIMLLTKPPQAAHAYAGKAAWVKKHFPKYFRRLLVGPKKHLLAHPEAVLVDDYEQNCYEFEGNGGHTVLVPSRGNKLHGLVEQTVEVVDAGLTWVKSQMETANY